MTTTRNKHQAELDRAATLCYDAIGETGAAEVFAAQDMISEALRCLLRAGAASPFQTKPAAPGLDLSDLVALDTPSARELLATLERAQEIAERVDRERGRCLPPDTPLQPGESRGTDLAESLSLLALRVRREVHGAKGRE